ncbi:MAG: hypothetical protein ACKO9W_14670, partial [Bacteroidota bacterium]
MKTNLLFCIAALVVTACTHRSIPTAKPTGASPFSESVATLSAIQNDTTPAWAQWYRASRPLDFRLVHTKLDLKPLFETAQLEGKAWI